MVEQLQDTGYDYVGISLDGLEDTHDRFRRLPGAFASSMRAVELCRQAGIKVGLRFTLTQDNFDELPALLKLSEDYDIDKFYLSHLNYAGRGNKNRGDDAIHRTTREAMDLLLRTAMDDVEKGREREFVTGNNDADGVFLYLWALQHFPDQAEHIREHLEAWGGNASGLYVANIDNLGNVHPDTFWWQHTLGNVRDTPFSELWRDTQDPLMLQLRQRPRPVKGRCGECTFKAICGGNTRIRALQLTNDPWAEDPACYLMDEEIGVVGNQPRLQVTPYSKRKRIGLQEVS